MLFELQKESGWGLGDGSVGVCNLGLALPCPMHIGLRDDFMLIHMSTTFIEVIITMDIITQSATG